MTPNQITLVQDSFRLLLPIRSQVARSFYARLFAVDPSTVPLFSGTDLEAQGAKLMAAIGFVVGALQRPAALLEPTRALAVRHVGYGVTEAHYASVGVALLSALQKALGTAFTPSVRDAWAAAYGLLSETMIHAASEALRARAPLLAGQAQLGAA